MQKTKSLLYLTILLISVCCISCKSNEDKAVDTIKECLSKNLNDFSSYEPIEFVIKEAYQTPFNDSTCYAIATAIAYGLKQIPEYIDKAKSAKEQAEIWGPPSPYTTSYADKQFHKYKEEMEYYREKGRQMMKDVNNIGLLLQDSISNLNPDLQLGWEVMHRFRCKNEFGNYMICNYRFVISKDFKDVMLIENADTEWTESVHDMIKTALSGTFSKVTIE